MGDLAGDANPLICPSGFPAGPNIPVGEPGTGEGGSASLPTSLRQPSILIRALVGS